MNRTRALENDEVHKLFACISGKFETRNRSMLICGISMALRATELCQLNVGDVRGQNGEIKTYVTIRAETAKRNKARKVRIGAQVRRALREFIQYKEGVEQSLSPDAPLFVSRQGGHLTRHALFHIVKNVLRRAGIEESPHCLRKTGATLYYIESGYDLLATQQFLGHADPSTTREYIGMTSEMLAGYSEKLSDVLFAVIDGEFNTNDDMLNSLKEKSNAELILELEERGFDVRALKAALHKREFSASKVVSIDALRRAEGL
jgi:integrase/recombinase XerD